jgi:hypothetical protein
MQNRLFMYILILLSITVFSGCTMREYSNTETSVSATVIKSNNQCE